MAIGTAKSLLFSPLVLFHTERKNYEYTSSKERNHIN